MSHRPRPRDRTLLAPRCQCFSRCNLSSVAPPLRPVTAQQGQEDARCGCRRGSKLIVSSPSASMYENTLEVRLAHAEIHTQTRCYAINNPSCLSILPHPGANVARFSSNSKLDHIRPKSSRFRSKFGQLRSNFGRCTKSDRIPSKSSKSWPISAKFDPLGPLSAKMGPTLTKLGPKSPKSGPMLDTIRPDSAEFGQGSDDSDRIWTFASGRVRWNLADVFQIWPISAKLLTSSTDLGPI